MTDPTQNAIPKGNPPQWKTVLFLCAIILTIGILAAPLFIHKSKCREGQTEQISNLRQIGLALFEFETEYGRYPDEGTAAEVTQAHPNQGLDLSGDSSNAMFRQLIAAGYTQSESMFYAKVAGARKPDGNITGGHALEKGEVGFGYVSGLSTAGNLARIIAFAPIIPGTKKFDPKPFKGKAAFLRMDNSALSLPINENGQAILNGEDILSPDHPIWEGKDPRIHYPE